MTFYKRNRWMWILPALILIWPGTATAQLGSLTLPPPGFTTSSDAGLAISRVRIRDLEPINTAAEGGPAWYSGVQSVSVSVYSLRSQRSGYALRVSPTGDAVSGSSHAVVPISVTKQITNEEQLRGCVSTSGGESRWLTPSKSRPVGLRLPSSRVQATRFC